MLFSKKVGKSGLRTGFLSCHPSHICLSTLVPEFSQRGGSREIACPAVSGNRLSFLMINNNMVEFFYSSIVISKLSIAVSLQPKKQKSPLSTPETTALARDQWAAVSLNWQRWKGCQSWSHTCFFASSTVKSYKCLFPFNTSAPTYSIRRRFLFPASHSHCGKTVFFDMLLKSLQLRCGVCFGFLKKKFFFELLHW